ncbi:MAG: dihydrofolate reductase family protein [Burkholderiaceae bacterium]|nr:dihydrofolate reductase family protein [Microbacteriaceae bacterium]
MRRLVVVENVSLDGVMQSPGRQDEDTRGGFERGGWASGPLMRDQEASRATMAGQESTTAMLFGRRTYLDLVGHWLTTADPNPFTEILTNTPKYVASSTLADPLPHPNSILLELDAEGDAVAAVDRLKAEGHGDIVVLGSGALVRSLAAAGLVDEYALTTIPVVVGSGARLFGDTPMDLRVVATATSPTGIVVARYAVG